MIDSIKDDRALDPTQLIMDQDTQLRFVELFTVGDTTTWFSGEPAGAYQFYGGQGSDIAHLGTTTAVSDFFGGAGDDEVHLNLSWRMQSLDRGGFSDELYGGAGDDRFVFAAGDSAGGLDHVYNFEAGAGSKDVIDLQAYGCSGCASCG